MFHCRPQKLILADIEGEEVYKGYWFWLTNNLSTIKRRTSQSAPYNEVIQVTSTFCEVSLQNHEIEPEYYQVSRSNWRRKWQPTPVFLPGESQGQRSLVGCCLWGSHRVGHDWSHLAAAAGPTTSLKETLELEELAKQYHKGKISWI